MANIERKAVLTLQQGEWPDNLTHGIWRAECMVQWLKDAGIALVDADLHQGAVADAAMGRALIDRMFELPRGPEWEQALAEVRVWSMKDHNPRGQ